jgi:formylglycine-generating enzyme required for sulfatase activity
MSGNVWEWCQDCHTRVIIEIPTDGSPLVSDSNDRVLRGGCFHNWAIHCTVSKRYEIGREFHDGCIGFRLVLAIG